MSDHPPEQDDERDDALSAEDGDADESPRSGSGGSNSGGIDDPEARFDHELIRRAQRGEEDAFSELVRRHEARAWRIARNLVGNNEDARDVAQEAFLRVFKSIEKFDFRHEFTTWLYRIVSNLGIDHLRRRRKHVSTAGVGADDEEYELDLPDEDGARPDERLDAIETAARVRECIDALAPHFRVVMALRELEGLPCADIARIVGATNVTVRWRLHRGRKLFQEEWERRAERRAAASERADSSETPGGGAPTSGVMNP